MVTGGSSVMGVDRLSKVGDKANEGQAVGKCSDSLVKLPQHNAVELIWMPGHRGICGNREADNLAKKGSHS